MSVDTSVRLWAPVVSLNINADGASTQQSRAVSDEFALAWLRKSFDILTLYKSDYYYYYNTAQSLSCADDAC